MATQKPFKQAGSNNDNAPADAFLNIAIIDANGVEHRLPKGIALMLDNKLQRSIINAAKAGKALKVSASVWIAPTDNNPDADIEL